MTLRELIAMEPGAVVMLDRPADEPLSLEVEGIHKMSGRPVLHRKHVGFMVSEIAGEEEGKSEGA
jgi:flagellar motor switch protein FliM